MDIINRKRCESLVEKYSNMSDMNKDMSKSKVTDIDIALLSKSEIPPYKEIAKKIYQIKTQNKLYDVGFVQHRHITYFGAFPDGVDIKNSQLVNIDVLLSHTPISQISPNVMMQIQAQLNICELDECCFIQYSFSEYQSKQAYTIDLKQKHKGSFHKDGVEIFWKLNNSASIIVERDYQWLQHNISTIDKLWHKMTRKQSRKRKYGENTLDGVKKRRLDEQGRSDVTSDSIYLQWAMQQLDCPRDIIQDKMIPEYRKYFTNNSWISPSQIQNHVLKDPASDFTKFKYGRQRSYGGQNRHPKTLEMKFQNGNLFEQKVYDHLFIKFGADNFIRIAKDFRKDFCEDRLNKFYETYEAMMQGIPIIAQGVLINPKNQTHGMADLIVRSDWINKLTNTDYLDNLEKYTKAPRFGTPTCPYHYRIIDIKWSVLDFKKDLLTLRSSGRQPVTKTQLYIYNEALGYLQGYTPDCAYVLGKMWKFDSKVNPQTEMFHFDRMGVVNFANDDSDVKDITQNAIGWIQELRSEGHHWTTNPPSRKELFPNMKYDSNPQEQKMKKQLAENIDEITLIWRCGIKNREIAHKQGIMKWTDPRCSAETLGIKNQRWANTIDAILTVNRSDYKHAV